MSLSARCVAWFAVVAAPVSATTVEIEKVVRTGDTVPGRPFETVRFQGRPTQLPGTINDAGVVAFQAHSENPSLPNDLLLGTRQGIYVRAPGEPLRVVADTTVTSAGGPGTFAVPGRPDARFDQITAAPLLNNNGDIVFHARYTDPVLGQRTGLFATTIDGTTTSIVKVVDTTDEVPGGTVVFTGFTTNAVGFAGLTLATLNDNGDLVFPNLVILQAQQVIGGLFAGSVTGAAVVRLADITGAYVPVGQTQPISFIALPLTLNNVGSVAFNGRLTGSLGGVFSVPVAGGPVSTVAFFNDPAPGSVLRFTSAFSTQDLNEDGTVLFPAQLDATEIEQGLYLGDVAGGPHSVVVDTLGAFAVPGRPAESSFDRVSYAAMNEAGQTAFFARVAGSGVDNDQGIYLADGSDGALVRVVDRGTAAPGIGHSARLEDFDPAIGSNNEVADGGSAAINDAGNLVVTATGCAVETTPCPAGSGLRGIYFYDRQGAGLVRITDSTVSAMAPPAGLGGTFAGTVQTLFGFQNTETRSGSYRTINESNEVTFLARFTGSDFGIYAAQITTGGGEPLEITCPLDVTAECPANTDPSVTGSATATGSGEITITFTDASTPGCGGTESITRTWTADNGSTPATCTQNIAEMDTADPTLKGVPGDQSVECDAVPVPAVPVGADACDATVEVVFGEVRTDGSCPAEYTLTRTWTASDGCGNDVSAAQTIVVDDTTAPTITCPPDAAPTSKQFDCRVTFNDQAKATDECSEVSVTSDPPLPVTFVQVGDHVITYTATDACNNSASCTTTVTVRSAARCLTVDAITALEELLAEDTDDDDLIQAIGYLQMSLGEADPRAGMSGSEVSWASSNHVDDCHRGGKERIRVPSRKGADVFQYQQGACDKLDAYVENRSNWRFDFADEIEEVRQILADADRMLAVTAIDDAMAAEGDPSEIAVAQKLLREGDFAAMKGGGLICDVALDKYAEAWEKAVKSWCPQ